MAQRRGERILVKVREDGAWYTVGVFYNWENACAFYNMESGPKMICTKHKVFHKQYKNNGFTYTPPDRRG